MFRLLVILSAFCVILIFGYLTKKEHINSRYHERNQSKVIDELSEDTKDKVKTAIKASKEAAESVVNEAVSKLKEFTASTQDLENDNNKNVRQENQYKVVVIDDNREETAANTDLLQTVPDNNTSKETFVSESAEKDENDIEDTKVIAENNDRWAILEETQQILNDTGNLLKY